MHDSAIVAILRQKDAAVAGCGVAVSPRGYIVTCAHVVADALHIARAERSRPDASVPVLFLHSQKRVEARVHAWSHAGDSDVAILHVDASELPEDVAPALLYDATPPPQTPLRACGFPPSYSQGVWGEAEMVALLPTGFLQVASGDLRPGFSGGPVVELDCGRLIGIVMSADTERETAVLIPARRIQAICSEVLVSREEGAYGLLTQGLPGDLLRNVRRFLEEYLGTSRDPKPFGGRGAQISELDAWLKDPSRPHALIAESAGRGKTALVVRWSAILAASGAAEVVLVPISMRFNTALKARATAVLGWRLRVIQGIHALGVPRNGEEWLDEVERVLQESRPPSSAPLVIVLDGLDEALDWRPGETDRLPDVTGKNIKLLVTARLLAQDRGPEAWLRRLQWDVRTTTLVKLLPLSRTGIADVLRSMGNPLDGLATDIDVLSELHRLSQGDPLLIGLYVEALRGEVNRGAFLRPEDLTQIPPGFKGYFERWRSEQRSRWADRAEDLEEAVRTVLAILACALGPLNNADLESLARTEGITGRTVADALASLSRYVIGDGREQGYIFGHPLLAIYFQNDLEDHKRVLWKNRFKAHCKSALDVLKQREPAPPETVSYSVQYYGAHMEDAECPGSDADIYELLDAGWLTAWHKIDGSRNGFLNDAGRAWRRADRSSDTVRQIECGLCFSSEVALSGNLPPALVVEALKLRIFTGAQALTLISRITDVKRRQTGLILLAPMLDENRLYEALAAAIALPDEELRADAILEMSPHLPDDVIGLAVDQSSAFTGDELRARFLCGLANRIPAQWFASALESARLIRKTLLRARAIAALVSHGSRQAYEPVIRTEIARLNQEPADVKVEALLIFADLTRDRTIFDDAQKAANSIKDLAERAQILRQIAICAPRGLQPDAIQQALHAARALPFVEDALSALAALGDSFPSLRPTLESECVKTLEKVESRRRAAPLRRVIRWLDAASIREMLADLPPSTDPALAIEIHLEACKLMPEAQNAEIAKTAAAWADELWDLEERARALVSIAAICESGRREILDQAIEIAANLTDSEARAGILVAAAECPEDRTPHRVSLQVALTRIRPVERALAAVLECAEDGRIGPLLRLLPLFNSERRQAIVSDALASSFDRGLTPGLAVEFLSALGEHASQEDRTTAAERALARLPSIKDADEKADAIIRLGKLLSPDVRRRIVERYITEFQAIKDYSQRLDFFAAIAPDLPEGPLKTGLEVTSAFTDASERVRVIGVFAPGLNADQRVRLADEVLHDYIDLFLHKLDAVDGLMNLLPAEQRSRLIDEGLQRARNLHGSRKALALANLSRRLAADKRRAVFAEALAEARRHQSSWPDHQVETWMEIAAQAEDDLRGEVAQEAIQTFLGKSRVASEMLIKGARRYMNEERLRNLLLACARDIEEPLERARALLSICQSFEDDASHTMKIACEASEFASEVRTAHNRIELLAESSRFVPEDRRLSLLGEALELLPSVEREHRLEALDSLISRLPCGERSAALSKAVQAAQEVADDAERADLLLAAAQSCRAAEQQELFDLAMAAVSRTAPEVQARFIANAYSVIPGQRTRIAEHARSIASGPPSNEVFISLAHLLTPCRRFLYLRDLIPQNGSPENPEQQWSRVERLLPCLQDVEKVWVSDIAWQSVQRLPDERACVASAQIAVNLPPEPVGTGAYPPNPAVDIGPPERTISTEPQDPRRWQLILDLQPGLTNTLRIPLIAASSAKDAAIGLARVAAVTGLSFAENAACNIALRALREESDFSAAIEIARNVSTHKGETILHTALQTARNLQEAGARARALAQLAPEFGTDLSRQIESEAETAARSIPDASERTRVTASLQGVRAATSIAPALDELRQMWSRIADPAGPGLAVIVASSLPSRQDRVQALLYTASNFRETRARAIRLARKTACAIDNSIDRVDGMLAVAHVLPESRRAKLAALARQAAQSIEQPREKVRACFRIAEASSGTERMGAWRDAIFAMDSVVDPAARIDDLLRASSSFEEDLSSSCILLAIETTGAISDLKTRTEMLRRIAGMARGGYRRCALIRAGFTSYEPQTEALLSEDKYVLRGAAAKKALESLARTSDVLSKARTAVLFLQPVIHPDAEMVAGVVRSIETVPDPADRVALFLEANRCCSDPHFVECAFAAAVTIADKRVRVEKLLKVLRTDHKLYGRVADQIQNVSTRLSHSTRVDALTCLLGFAPADQVTVLRDSIARLVEETAPAGKRLRQLLALIPYFPTDQQLLLLTQSSESLTTAPPAVRAVVLAELARHLPESILDRAGEFAAGLPEASDRARAMLTLAERSAGFARAVSSSVALRATIDVRDQNSRSQLLARSIPLIEQSHIHDATSAILTLDDPGARSDLITSLAIRASDASWDPNPVAGQIHRVLRLLPAKEQTLRCLALLREVEGPVRSALERAHLASAQGDAIQIHAQIASTVTMDSIFESIQNAAEEWDRAEILSSAASEVPEESLPQMLDCALAIEHDRSRIRALEPIARRLAASTGSDRQTAAQAFSRAIHTIARRERPVMLEDLAALMPFALAMDDRKDTVALADAVLSVTAWWP